VSMGQGAPAINFIRPTGRAAGRLG
jgi:hypothetical protein